MVRYQRRTKQELCDAIYSAVRDAGRPVTRLEIADAIGLKKSNHVWRMADALVDSGWLKRSQSPDKWGRATFIYSIGIVVSSTVEACGEVAV